MMKLGILFSGGKDSTLALHRAAESHEIACLITVVSENPASFMFHTPNIDLTGLQAEALGVPLVRVTTKGEKETELADLQRAITAAKETYGIEGVVTGAVRSTYQAARVQRICHELGLWCFNPLWLKDQVVLLREVVSEGYDVIISGVAAEGVSSLLGEKIVPKTVDVLERLAETARINPAGEGGEFESTVLDAPLFKKRIGLVRVKKEEEAHAGVLRIEEARLVEK